MWTIPSAGRWIFLLSLMLVLIFSVSEVTSVHPPCCRGGSNDTVSEHDYLKWFAACYKQNPRPGCNYDAFVLQTKKGKKYYCFSPKAEWLLNMIKEGKLECKPI